MDKQLKRQRFLRLCLYTGLAGAVLLAVYLLYRFTGIGLKCPLYEITGLKCPGCGNTHALEGLLRLNFKKSLEYNYLYPFEFFYIGWVYLMSSKNYLAGGKFSYNPKKPVLETILIIMLVVWFPVRNILGI